MDNPELTEQLMMLRLADVKELKEVLKALQKSKARRGNTRFGSSKFRQKLPALPDLPRDVNHRSEHAVRAPYKIQVRRDLAWIIRITRET